MSDKNGKTPPQRTGESKKSRDDIVEESTEGNSGVTGSGGVASQSPTPGHPPRERNEKRKR